MHQLPMLVVKGQSDESRPAFTELSVLTYADVMALRALVYKKEDCEVGHLGIQVMMKLTVVLSELSTGALIRPVKEFRLDQGEEVNMVVSALDVSWVYYCKIGSHSLERRAGCVVAAVESLLEVDPTGIKQLASRCRKELVREVPDKIGLGLDEPGGPAIRPASAMGNHLSHHLRPGTSCEQREPRSRHRTSCR